MRPTGFAVASLLIAITTVAPAAVVTAQGVELDLDIEGAEVGSWQLAPHAREAAPSPQAPGEAVSAETSSATHAIVLPISHEIGDLLALVLLAEGADELETTWFLVDGREMTAECHGGGEIPNPEHPGQLCLHLLREEESRALRAAETVHFGFGPRSDRDPDVFVLPEATLAELRAFDWGR